jgi:prolyl-tRNA editing enzyme YbaK/EbsC (Cys-tRNA(Pro) deacylase)
MSQLLSASAEKVQETLKAFGIRCQVIELPGSTRTAQDAASAVGCRVEQIAKSIVFEGKSSGKPVMVIASGSNRVNEKKLRDLISEPVKKADADFVRVHTGYAIGGVPPVGHATPIEIYIDEDLMGHAEIWAAAGTPHAVFKLTPQELVTITGGKAVSIGHRTLNIDH